MRAEQLLAKLRRAGRAANGEGELMSLSVIETGILCCDFWDGLSVWSQQTFGPDTERGPTGPLKHLAKEIQECLEKPHDEEEYADLLHLVFDAARRAGIRSPHQFFVTAMAKLAKNRGRKWGSPSSDDLVEHIRDGET